MENAAAPQVRFGEWISEGWKVFTDQWKGWVVLSIGLFCAIAVPMMIFMFFMFGTLVATAQPAGPHRQGDVSPFGVLVIVGGVFLIILITLPLSALLMGGMYRAAFKQLRGGQIEFADLFSARDCYLRLLGTALLHGVLIAIASAFCIIPGFIAGGLLFFSIPLVVERDMGPLEALQESFNATRQNWLMFTLFAFVVQFIASLGSYACYIGLLVTWPLMFTMTAVAYRDCFGLSGVQPARAPDLWSASGYSPPPPTGNPSQPAEAVCPNCQAPLPRDARFCFRCGTQTPGA